MQQHELERVLVSAIIDAATESVKVAMRVVHGYLAVLASHLSVVTLRIAVVVYADKPYALP